MTTGPGTTPRPRAEGRGSGPAGATVRWRIRLAYDGSGFRGFAAQDGQRTVAGELAEAFGRAARVEPASIRFTCAGRTDAGVHAEDQVVHVDLPAEAAPGDPAKVVRSCNRQLGPAIVVREAGEAEDGFDARRSAAWRRYRYRVVEAPEPDPLLAGVAWHVTGPLDLRTMAAAADAVVGEHDFRAFCRRPPGAGRGDAITRRVLDARWREVPASSGGLVPARGRLLELDITATSFCHQMVRSLVGTFVDVGLGRKRASDIVWILSSAERSLASQPAPPHGLCLAEVRYGR